MVKKPPPETKRPSQFKVGRDAKTGQFISVGEARRKKATAIVETIKRQVRTPKKPKKTK